jgi:hypothetical protein
MRPALRCLAITAALATAASSPAQQTTLLHNATLIDGTGGTDSGATPGRIPGFSEHRELEDLVTAGLTPLQAITDATGSTGKLSHSLDPTLNVGLISPGFSADIIILAADPLTDIRNTRKIAAIYHHGKLIPNPAPQDQPKPGDTRPLAVLSPFLREWAQKGLHSP